MWFHVRALLLAGIFYVSGFQTLCDAQVVQGRGEVVVNDTPYTNTLYGHGALPSISSNSSGAYVVVWKQWQAQNGDDILVQQFAPNGQRIGTNFVANTTTQYGQDRPCVAVDASGGFVVAWEDLHHDGSERGIFAQRFDANGRKVGAEFRVNTYSLGNQTSPYIAMSPDGRFVIVWSSWGQDGSGEGIYAQCYLPDGTRNGSEFRVNESTVNRQYNGNVAMDANGSFVVAWTDDAQTGSEFNVRARRFNPDGVPLTGEFLLSSKDSRTSKTYYSDCAPAFDANGNWIVVWSQRGPTTDGEDIFARRFKSSGEPLGDEFRVNSLTQGEQGGAAVAFDRSGGFTVVWRALGDQDGDSWGCFGQIFGPDGEPRGAEFGVNTTTAGSQNFGSSAVAIGEADEALVVWSGPVAGVADNNVAVDRFRVTEQPGAGTRPVTKITATTAVLNGRVSSNSADATAFFLWGNQAGATTQLTATPQLIPARTSNAPVSASLENLQPHTTYFVRVAATSQEGTTLGEEIQFQTLNRVPSAADDYFHPPAGQGVLPVLGNDSDPDGDSLTIGSVTAGSHGTVTIEGRNLVFHPSSSFTGSDVFSYTISDGFGGSATATVTLGNSPPVSQADVAICDGQTVEIAVLGNDTDPDQDALEIIAVSQGAFGSVLTNGAVVTYQPGPDFFGRDSFTYTITDGQGTISSSTVHLRASVPITVAAIHSGATFPEQTPGATLSAFGTPAVNEQGMIACTATSRIGRQTSNVILAGNPLRVEVSERAGAPGIPGYQFATFEPPALDHKGNIAFLATTTQGKTNRVRGLWTNAFEQRLTLVAQEGAPAPEISGARLKRITSFALSVEESSDALLVFTGSLVHGRGASSRNSSAMWAVSQGNSALLLMTGQSLEIDGQQLEIASFKALRIRRSSAAHGSGVMNATVAANVRFTNGQEALLQLGAGTPPRLIAGSGTLSPWLLPAVEFKSFGMPLLNQSGRAIFSTKMAYKIRGGQDVVFSGLVQENADHELSVIAYEGFPAPGVNGAAFTGFEDPVHTSTSSAFIGTIRGSGVTSRTNTGIWQRSGDDLVLLAREGDVPPGVTGAIWTQFTSLALREGLDARVLFVAKMKGISEESTAEKARVNTSSHTGLWATDNTGTLRLIARTGESRSANGAVKEIAQLSVLEPTLYSPAQRRSYTEAGVMAYLAWFTDGSEAIFRVRLP